MLLEDDLTGDSFLLTLDLTGDLLWDDLAGDLCLGDNLVGDKILKGDLVCDSSLLKERLIFECRLGEPAGELLLMEDNLADDSFSMENEETGKFICSGDDLICGMSLLMDKPAGDSSFLQNDLAND